MEEGKDYLWYFWNTYKQDWIEEFKYLWTDKTLKGMNGSGMTDSKELPKEKDFDLEMLMVAQDIINSYFNISPRAIKHMGNAFPLRNL